MVILVVFILALIKNRIFLIFRLFGSDCGEGDANDESAL